MFHLLYNNGSKGMEPGEAMSVSGQERRPARHLVALSRASMAALALALAACGGGEGGKEGSAKVGAQVAAVVNGETIFTSDVQMEAEAQGLIDKGKALEVDSAEFNQVLDQLIDTRLMSQAALKRGLDEDPVARYRLETARERILGVVLVDAVVAERVDEAAIKRTYDQQIAIMPLGDETRVRRILADSKEAIDKIAAELATGAQFPVVAASRSTDETTKMDGGDLGYIADDDMPPDLERVIKATSTGGVSKPFQTAEGWQVIKVEERRKQQPPTLEELRPKLLSHLTMLQVEKLLKELRKDAKINHYNSPANAPLDTDPFSIAPEEKPVAKPAAKPAPGVAQPPATPDEQAPSSTPSGEAKPQPNPVPARNPARPDLQSFSAQGQKPDAAATASPKPADQ